MISAVKHNQSRMEGSRQDTKRRKLVGEFDDQAVMRREHVRWQAGGPSAESASGVIGGGEAGRGLSRAVQGRAGSGGAWLGCGASRRASTIQTSTPRRMSKAASSRPSVSVE